MYFNNNETDTFHCSFCDKDEAEVAAMIKGPDENICDECVASCDELIDVDAFKVDGSVRCSFCSKNHRVLDKDAVSTNVSICEECIDLCKEIVEEHQWKKTGYTFCSFFCRKTTDQVPFIITGENENICSECVNLFSTMLEQKAVRLEIGQSQNCAFCGISGMEKYLTGLANFICGDCLEICKEHIKENA